MLLDQKLHHAEVSYNIKKIYSRSIQKEEGEMEDNKLEKERREGKRRKEKEREGKRRNWSSTEIVSPCIIELPNILASDCKTYVEMLGR